VGIFEKIPKERWNELAGLLLLGLAALLFVCYFGYGPRSVITFSSAEQPAEQPLGSIGSVISRASYLSFGWSCLALPTVVLIWGFMWLFHRRLEYVWLGLAGLVLLLFGLSAVLDLASRAGDLGLASPGGVVGSYGADRLTGLFGRIGAFVVSGTVLAIAVLLTTERFFIKIMIGVGRVAAGLRSAVAAFLSRVKSAVAHARAQKESRSPVAERETRKGPTAARKKPAPRKPKVETEAAEPPESRPARAPTGGYHKPPHRLLDLPERAHKAALGKDLRSTSAMLESTLRVFGVEADVVNYTRGPTITRYELEPEPGTKVAKFVSLADDLALALKAHRVRVEAPIPGKGRVGVEVPNDERENVCLRDILESPAFVQSRSKLTLALGKDIAGDPVIADLGMMPHLLIAGATGSGKTVCVKSIVASLLFNATPDEVEMLMIDPKMVELSIFNGIPHLISPVVTDPKKAAASLDWLIREMEARYKLFTALGLRNIEIYNEKIRSGELEFDQETVEELAGISRRCVDFSGSTPKVKPLPYIVVLIDEMADLMMIARVDVEDAILRLAQLARAVGIHLVIATQRPSVDVVTGVIKANFTHRIAFQVSSKVDSRTIMDMMGAERLIGAGDMLYLIAGSSKPTRTQGVFVSDDEMGALIRYLKTQGEPRYREEVVKWQDNYAVTRELMGEQDELYDAAVRVVMETGQASISMVQRRLRVGYNRAARLIDAMEQKGIVGPAQGSQPREILGSPG
jgi:S-DNA-T family DNA segregation ATPase FtsK/SpoIIIE